MTELSVRQVRRDELAAVAGLHAASGPAMSPAKLEWEYFDRDLAREGVLVGAYDGDALIGTQGFIPYPGWWKDRTILTCKSESTLLSPEYRGRKLFDRMYALGFELCGQAGIDCIWGFTSAEKPFSKLGFDVSGELFQEILSWSPLRLYRAIRHGTGASLSRGGVPPAATVALDALHRRRPGEFGVDRDARYLRHRYVNNPSRDIAAIDEAAGVLFSYGGRHPFLLRVSEVVDRSRLKDALRRCKARIGKDFWGIERFTNHPVLGWGTLPGTVYYRRKTAMRIVFKWLGPLAGQPVPSFDVEEGYTEGLR